MPVEVKYHPARISGMARRLMPKMATSIMLIVVVLVNVSWLNAYRVIGNVCTLLHCIGYCVYSFWQHYDILHAVNCFCCVFDLCIHSFFLQIKETLKNLQELKIRH